MQIIQFLFKACNTCGRSQKEKCSIVEEAKSTDISVCFYSALQLKRPDILRYDRNCGSVEMGHKEEAVAGGCKVLPICICDMATLGSGDCREVVQKEALKWRRAGVRMKEVLRWAAAVKSSSIGGIKGWKVLYLRNKMASKDPISDASSNSRKVSFGWDVGSCSTSSSVFSPKSMPLPSRRDQMWSNNLSNQPATLQAVDSNASSVDSLKSECNRAAQWITTDSDFVVLEL